MIEALLALLSAIILGTARAADGADKISRTAYVVICYLVVYANTTFTSAHIVFRLLDTAAWMWVLCVLTMLPPHALFSAIHGEAPKREDGRWQWLQIAAKWMADHPKALDWQYWYWFAILYGAIRTLLIIPAVIWLNEPWIMLAMLQGVLMWVCGKVSKTHAVRMQEFISAAFIGGMI